MTWKDRTDGAMPDSNHDPVLEEALSDFRAGVNAWSEAAYKRPRTQVHAAVHGGWRMAAAWAMGCVLALGAVSGALYERHHREVMAKLAEQAREAQQRQQAAQPQHVTDEDLLATVDNDISRDVPAAMEPLENLMDESSAQ